MSAVEPSRDCPRCPRLVAFREAWRAKEPSWFNAPVASFGAADARLLIVGLAPGLQGANRTGRPFTGDYAGVLLYETLVAFGFARGKYQARPDDGLSLADARISNAVRCVPPENKPTPQEINTCRDFLIATIAESPGASNRMVGERAGIADQGQASKLLRRLHRHGLIEHQVEGRAKGEAYAWTLTDRGWAVHEALSA